MIARLVRTGGSWANYFHYYCARGVVHFRRAENSVSGEVCWRVMRKCDCDELAVTEEEISADVPSQPPAVECAMERGCAMHRIIVEEVQAEPERVVHLARILGAPEESCEIGKTQEEAVGRLVMTNSHLLGLSIHYIGDA